MKTFLKFSLFFATLMVLLAVLAGGALWHEIAQSGQGVHLVINGDELELAEIGGAQVGGALLGLMVAGLVLFLVVPLVLLLGLGLPLLIIGGIGSLLLAGAVGLGALLCSPLILLGLLVLWLLRRDARERRAA